MMLESSSHCIDPQQGFRWQLYRALFLRNLPLGRRVEWSGLIGVWESAQRNSLLDGDADEEYLEDGDEDEDLFIKSFLITVVYVANNNDCYWPIN